jgi:hypothetical protein
MDRVSPFKGAEAGPNRGYFLFQAISRDCGVPDTVFDVAVAGAAGVFRCEA